VNELDPVIKIPSARRQQAWEALATAAHACGSIAWAIGRASEGANHVVFHAGPGKYRGAQHIGAAAAKGWRALVDNLVSFHLVDRVRKRVGAERMFFFVATRGAPADEDEWWSCGLDSAPDMYTQTESLRWHCRESFVLAPPSRFGTGQDVRWVRRPAHYPLPDALRLLEYLADACEEEGC